MSVHEAPPASDLIERLQQSATDAIANLAAAIDSDAGRLRSITVELELANNGAVIDSRCFVERRGVHRAKGA